MMGRLRLTAYAANCLDLRVARAIKLSLWVPSRTPQLLADRSTCASFSVRLTAL